MILNKSVFWLCFVVAVLTKKQLQQVFNREPSDVAATLGGKVILPCQVENKGGVLQWTRDEFGLGQKRSLPGFPRMAMVGDDMEREWNLEISPVQLEDEAVYQCQVMSTGTMLPIRSGTARLMVLIPSGPPTISKGPSVAMTENVKSNLSCQAEGGKPAAQLEWRVDGINIKNIETKTEKIPGSLTFKTVSRLNLVPSKLDDGLSVSCFIPSTGETSSVVLNVSYKPDVKLTRVGEEKIILEGDTVIFSCKALGKPSDFLYTWMVKEVETVHTQDQENLVMDQISRQHHHAWVKCLVRNSVGVGQDQQQLLIHYKPKILTHPTSFSANEGEKIHLECKADANPAPAISWHKVNSTEIIGTGQLLTLTLTHSTSGSYFCSAHSAMFPSNIMSHIARVTVSRGPTITSSQKQVAEMQGSQAMVRCKADTFGLDATVAWSFQGESVASGEQYVIENIVQEQEFESVLTINHAKEDDFGHYLCTIENALGSDSKNILVTFAFNGIFHDLLLLQIFLGTAGLLTCILSVFAVRKFCQSLQHTFGEVPQIREDEEDFRPDLYQDKVVRDIMENKKETKMNAVHDEHDQDVNAGDVLHAINMDYAAFYGNPHLSNNLMEDDSEEEDPDQRTFSSHPYLIT